MFDVLYKKGLSPDGPTSIRIAIEICDAMAAVHAKGIMLRYVAATYSFN
jgi:hypothetical protein